MKVSLIMFLLAPIAIVSRASGEPEATPGSASVTICIEVDIMDDRPNSDSEVVEIIEPACIQANSIDWDNVDVANFSCEVENTTFRLVDFLAGSRLIVVEPK